VLGGVDGNLHFPVPSMNRLNQTEPATFLILPCWAFFRDSVFIYLMVTPVSGVVSYGMLLFWPMEGSIIISSECQVVLISFILIRKNQVNKYVVIFVFFYNLCACAL
jgi:hypothetical protein